MRFKLALLLLITCAPLSSHAITAQVVGGQTSVLFGNGALETLGLEISSVTPNVWGDLGPNSVAFGINPRNAIDPSLSTTFEYESDDFFAFFAGAIEHTGRVAFNDGAIVVGDFTIEAPGGRPADASGFVVTSTFGLEGLILFDLANPIIEAFENSLTIAADIWVSPELADALSAPQFAGEDAGMALVVAKSMPIPLPAVGWLFLGGLGVILPKIRRRST